VDRGALATLLGDSENPSHTEWQRDSKNFRGKYTYGGVAIDFVSSFANELVKRIHSTSKQLDRKLLLDLFFDETPERPEEAPKPKPDIVTPTDEPDIPEEPAHSQIRISETKDGFSMSATGAPFASGTVIAVRVAYETSKGNPFKAYKPYDFNLGNDLIEVASTGCSIRERMGNQIVVNVIEPSFTLKVSGFDVNRDIVVKAKVEMVQSETETGAAGSDN
jgi:hypothetical protein